MYAGTARDISTFGVYATLVTTNKAADETVYQLVKAVFDSFPSFKRQHPAFKDLNAREMTTAGLTAPLHPGALRYYTQAGWR